MSGRRRGGTGQGVVTALLAALGCCLLAAPAAHADFDDLLDTVLGAATAADVDLGGIPGDPGDLGDIGDLGVLQDPLGQLDQLFHDTPSSADSTPDTPADGAPDTPADGTPDGTPDGTGSAEHGSESGSSNNLPSIPKFSIPSTGSGSGGSGGGGSGGSGGGGGPAVGGAKTKANTSATPATVPAR